MNKIESAYNEMNIPSDVISEEKYNKIKENCPQLSFDEIMRLIDLFKSGAVNI
jgi:hypothetical protein